MLWSTVSKAFFRSINKPIACFLLFVAFDISIINSITACAVDFFVDLNKKRMLHKVIHILELEISEPDL